jgi:hypothetical protein
MIIEPEIRNPNRNANGTINVEFNHPKLGWIPFTANPDDVELLGRDIYAAADATAVAYTGPTLAEVALTNERGGMVVSRFQARAALLQSGLLATAETAIQSGDALTQMVWADAQEFRRSSPTVAAIASVLSLTETEIDDLFRLAITIEA